MNATYKTLKLLGATALLALPPFLSYAQESAATNPQVTGAYDTIRYVLAGFALLLLFVIIALGSSIKATLALQKKQKAKNKAKIAPAILMFLGFMTLSQLAMAQAEPATVVEEPGFWMNLFQTAPNDMLVTILIIIVELAAIFGLMRVQIRLLSAKKAASQMAAKAPFTWAGLLEKLGANKASDDIEGLDLNHDYDGIRELDNNIPKWWQLSFLGTVIIAGIYLVRMFVTGDLLDQESELAEANRVAEIQMAHYLKNAANNVDENSVVMLDAMGIAEGASLYAKNCVACHGAAGEGTIGPNLTDAYWFHKGGIKDIFYSIKYGWPEKGMKAWSADFSPAQMAQIASYVKSLAGTQPANAKAQEGELYEEELNVEAAPETAETETQPAS